MKILLSLVVACLVSSVGCGGSDGDGDAPKPAEALYYHAFPTVTASLSGTSDPRQLRVTFTFVIDPKDKDRAIEIIDRETPELINEFLLLLSQYDSNTIADPKNLDKLRAEVCKAVNKRADGAPIVQNVLFGKLQQL